MNTKAIARSVGTRTTMTVHADDNVMTLLDYAMDCTITADGLVIDANVPFGHKVANATIEEGQPIIKYGVVIGVATQDIACGAHVHVHNIR